MTYRVIVTGCRDWANQSRVADALWALSLAYAPGLAVSVGDCPSGADLFARSWCDTRHVPLRVFKADWKALGPKAGPLRNAEMVAAGADLCLAFWDGKSRGTLDCLSRAAAAGIPVRIISAPPSTPQA